MKFVRLLWKLPQEAIDVAWDSIRSIAPPARHNARCLIPRRTHFHPGVEIIFAGADVS